MLYEFRGANARRVEWYSSKKVTVWIVKCSPILEHIYYNIVINNSSSKIGTRTHQQVFTEVSVNFKSRKRSFDLFNRDFGGDVRGDVSEAKLHYSEVILLIRVGFGS